MYSLIPQDWDSAMRAYRAALLAEEDYSRRVWLPGFHRGQAGGAGNSHAIEEEIERLQDIRCSAENVLLEIPAPTLAEFAVKYLISFDNDRDNNGWHEDLCAEAKRLLGIKPLAESGEMAVMLNNINWNNAVQMEARS